MDAMQVCFADICFPFLGVSCAGFAFQMIQQFVRFPHDVTISKVSVKRYDAFTKLPFSYP